MTALVDPVWTDVGWLDRYRVDWIDVVDRCRVDGHTKWLDRCMVCICIWTGVG